MTRGRLPHSEIPGSKLICSSPGLIAACHVLHRLLAPRHSPYTLSSLTIRNSELTITGVLHTHRSTPVPMQTLRVCGRKKLPFAEYSVVKDQTWGASPPRPPARSLAGALRPGSVSLAKTTSLFRSPEAAKLITSALRPVRFVPPTANSAQTIGADVGV